MHTYLRMYQRSLWDSTPLQHFSLTGLYTDKTIRCHSSPGLINSITHHFRLRNDLYCVEWGVKLYSLTQLLITNKPKSSLNPGNY